MGIENAKTVQYFWSRSPALPMIIKRSKPSRFAELRSTYRAARMSLPSVIRLKPVSALIIRALLHGGQLWPDIVGHRRFAKTSAVRQRIAWLLYETTGWSSHKVADVIGKVDHTTVIHARRKIEGLIVAGAVMDRGVPFLRARDVAKVGRLREDMLRVAGERASAVVAKYSQDAAYICAFYQRLESRAAAAMARHLKPEHLEVVMSRAQAAGVGLRHLVGQTGSPKATAARDIACATLRDIGVTSKEMAPAFGIPFSHVTISANRGERRIMEFAR